MKEKMNLFGEGNPQKQTKEDFKWKKLLILKMA